MSTSDLTYIYYTNLKVIQEANFIFQTSMSVKTAHVKIQEIALMKKMVINVYVELDSLERTARLVRT